MKLFISSLLFCMSLLVHSATITTEIYATGSNQNLGKVTFTDNQYGLIIAPDLSLLPPGIHGFHLHQHANCGDHGMNAGAHFDPAKTNSHQGPYGNGHLGDLPALVVEKDGRAHLPTLAPRLKTSDLYNLAVMIHVDGDNYQDHPPLGGGGERLACGIILKAKT